MTSEDVILHDCESIERYFLNATGMKPGFTQLSAGLIELNLHTVCLAGVTLIWTHSSGHQRWRDTMTEDGLHFGFAVESEGPIIAPQSFCKLTATEDLLLQYIL